MKYKNTKTGAVIETASVCSGGDWVEVRKEPAKKTSKPQSKKKDVLKNE